jgi:hypothetical protein
LIVDHIAGAFFLDETFRFAGNAGTVSSSSSHNGAPVVMRSPFFRPLFGLTGRSKRT